VNSCTILVPTYSRALLLRGALESIQKLLIPPGWQVEVLVVDNGSKDNTTAIVEDSRRAGPLDVRHVVESRQGLNYARNRGLLEADSEWVIYLDDDMLVNPEWVLGLVEAAERHAPDCVIGPVEPWFEQAPDSWLTPRVVRSVTSPYSQKGNVVHLVENKLAHELPGCNFAVRREAALEAGGFHPSLDRAGKGMLAGGDFEFGVRLARLGRPVVYSPRCLIRHFISQAKVSVAGLRARWQGMGATGRAFERLDGKEPSSARLVRDHLRMFRFLARSLHFRLVGKRGEAFEAELDALHLRGYLWMAPALEPRPWPPRPLSQGQTVD